MQPTTPKAPLLGLFWLGIQMVWGALLGVSLQVRSSQLAPHHSLAAYGTLAAVGAGIAAVTQIFIGIVSDRRRARGSCRVEFYAIGVVAACGALFWFYAAHTYAQLLGSVVLLQCGMNVAIGPYQAAIPDFIEDQRMGTASSWMAGLQSVGNAAGAVVAGLVADTRAVALCIASVLFVTCALSALHVRRLTLLPASPVPLLITRSFVDLFVSRALIYTGFYTLLGYLYFYVLRTIVGDAKMTTGIVLLAFTAAGAAGAALVAAPANRSDRRAVATFGGGKLHRWNFGVSDRAHRCGGNRQRVLRRRDVGNFLDRRLGIGMPISAAARARNCDGRLEPCAADSANRRAADRHRRAHVGARAWERESAGHRVCFGRRRGCLGYCVDLALARFCVVG